MIAALAASTTAGATVAISQLGADIDGEAADDWSGNSISLSSDGTTVAIGALRNDNVGGANAGHVRIYRFTNNAWTQIGLDIDGQAAGDNFGYSVSLSGDGNTVAIGAPNNDNVRGTNAGHVRIYRFTNNAWTKIGSDIVGEAAEDKSGWSVSLSSDGTAVAIGAPYNSVNDSGHVRVYKKDNVIADADDINEWTRIGADIDGEATGDNSGWSVSLSDNGETVAIGAYRNDGTSGNTTDSRGHVRVHRLTNNAWTQIGADIDGEAAGDFSGYSVSLSADGNIVAIGAYTNNNGSGTDAGHVRVYQLTNNAWTQIGLDIDGEAAGDNSGYSVSLSGDGNIVAIGATGNESYSGHTRIFQWDGSIWTQLGSDIDSEAAGDGSGEAVSLSSNGGAVAIGAMFNSDNGNSSGHTRVFRIATAVAPPPAPVSPIWRASLDPNGGTCVDTTSHTDTWTSVFVGYRYLPNATDCTRAGYTFTGWANTTTPNTPTGLPLLTDPSDGTRRNFIAANADLIAIWTADPEPITNLTVFANFLCGPCTTIWLIHTPAPADTSVDITIDDTPATCSIEADAFGLTFCQITSLTPGTHTITLTPRNSTITAPPTNTTITLRS
jgi:hypothetical protein